MKQALHQLLHKAVQHFPLRRAVFDLLRHNIMLPKSIYQHLYFNGPMKIALGHSSSFKMQHHGWQVENDLYWAGAGNGWEATSLRLWARLAQSADTILDIGANTGAYSLIAGAISPSARIYAFEPLDRIYQFLKQNALMNPFSIEPINCAVSNEDGEAVFYDTQGGNSYAASLEKSRLEGVKQTIEYKVHKCRIDDFMAAQKYGQNWLVKIDVELHEPEVLSGFGALIATHQPLILIEVLSPEIGSKIEAFVAHLGYRYLVIDEKSGAYPADSLAIHNRNCLLIPASKIEALGLQQGISHEALAL